MTAMLTSAPKTGKTRDVCAQASDIAKLNIRSRR